MPNLLFLEIINWAKFELKLELDSREMLELLRDVEVIFEIEINFDTIYFLVKEGKLTTIQDFIQYIERE